MQFPKSPVHPERPSTWKLYKEGACQGCWSGCCTLPVEVKLKDLLRLGYLSEFELTESPKKLLKKLQKLGIVRSYHSKTEYFVLEQRGGRDCVFLDEKTRRCTVYLTRPDTCRNFPEVGPRPRWCPAIYNT